MAATQRDREFEEENRRLRKRVAELEAKVEQLEELLRQRGKRNASKGPKIDYSLGGNQELLGGRKRKEPKKSPGRRTHAEKAELFGPTVNVYPEGVAPEACVFRAIQYGRRIIDGKAVLVRYNLYAPPGATSLPTPPGMRNRRSEFGSEIVVSLAYLHYWVGLSIDNACDVLRYFTQLDLSKSQADSLLNQLANDWHDDYEAIAALIALQMIVYVDETAWKVGDRSCYTWAFSSANYILYRCGVGRGQAEAREVLGKSFGGVGVSDDYAAYDNLFAEHQLCWAHFIRKAIKIALQAPDDPGYKEFLDRLYAIFCEAKRIRDDNRLTVGRAQKVAQLKQAIIDLCIFADMADEDDMPSTMRALIRLQQELVDNIDCLFVFVEKPDVQPTNNLSERNVRREAEIRKGGRTSKSEKGAKRRSIIMTVFASLRSRVETLNLETVQAEVSDWIAKGRSIFAEELEIAKGAAA